MEKTEARLEINGHLFFPRLEVVMLFFCTCDGHNRLENTFK